MIDRHPAFDELLAQAQGGRLTRRQLLVRAVALGLTTSSIGAILAACGGDATPAAAPAAAPTGTTAAAPAPAAAGGTAPAARPTTAPTTAAAPAPTKRGGGGQLKLLWWQAPTILNPHLSTGTTNFDASRVVYEPLATFDTDEKLFPVLAAEVPTRENGGLAEDGKGVTWKLKPGIKWSDGQPMTADDVIFTWEYIVDPQTASTSSGTYIGIEKIDKIDDLTVKINFKQVTPGWFTVFTSSTGGVLPKHVFQEFKGVNAKNAPANLKPVGTGAFRVTDFKPGDTILYEINPNYREPNRPFFDTIQLKGGGDAPSAATAVMETGAFDFAWNLQVEVSVLKPIEDAARAGELVIYQGASVERVVINYTDPNKEIDGERSSLKAPHPFQTELKVRQAYALLCDRDTIAKALYGKTGVATANLLVAPAAVNSKNTKYEFSIEKANALLDEAGWRRGPDNIRAKDGVKMSVVFQTSVNSLRQKEQQLIKQAFDRAGIQMEIKSVDQSQFFSSGANSNDNLTHFYADLQMFTSGPTSPDPTIHMLRYLSTEIPQKANNWGPGNAGRYQSKEYDALYNRALTELDPAKRNELFIQMNDQVVKDAAEVALVYRTGAVAKGKNLNWVPNAAWDSNLYRVADWTKS